MEDPATLKERIAKITQEQSGLREKCDDLRDPITHLSHQQKDIISEKRAHEQTLRRLTNTAQQQLEHVKRTDSVSTSSSLQLFLCLGDFIVQRTYEALLWVRQNSARFRFAVYGPIFNEVRFQSQLHAQWFENCIPRHVLLSFVTQCKEDYDLLLNEVRDKKGIPINCLLADVGYCFHGE